MKYSMPTVLCSIPRLAVTLYVMAYMWQSTAGVQQAFELKQLATTETRTTHKRPQLRANQPLYVSIINVRESSLRCTWSVGFSLTVYVLIFEKINFCPPFLKPFLYIISDPEIEPTLQRLLFLDKYILGWILHADENYCIHRILRCLHLLKKQLFFKVAQVSYKRIKIIP